MMHSSKAICNDERQYRHKSLQERSMLNHDGPEMKRSRGRNWSDEEIEALLELRQKAARQGAGSRTWDYFSVRLYKQRGIDRASKSCMHQWDTLLNSFNTIRWHESKTMSGTSSSYWEMDKDERSKNKLPQEFNMEWFKMMETILSTISMGEQTCTSSGLPTSKSQLDEAVSGESEVEDTDTGSEYEEVSGDSTTTIESQAGDSVYGHVPQSNQTCSRSLELVVEPIAQVSKALEIIENVCKISSMVRVNKNQCKRIAERFSVIAEGLKVMRSDKDSSGGRVLDGDKDYPGFDELLTVLRKGEALVSYYSTRKGIISAASRTDNRKAFLEIHQELDTLDSQFHFEGSDENYIGLASGVERSALLTEDAEKDLKEMPKKLEELVRIEEDSAHTSQARPDLDLETLQQVVSEKSKLVGEDYLRIDLSTVENKAPVRDLVRHSTQDPTGPSGPSVKSGNFA